MAVVSGPTQKRSLPVTALEPPAPKSAIPERPVDEWDALFRKGGTVNLHADTALHNLTLAGDGNPGPAMQGWMRFMKGLGYVFPKLTNFTRQVTLDSLMTEGTGIQVFSAVTRGLQPFYNASHRLYSRVAAWPTGADQTPATAWLKQAAWVHEQVARHPEQLMLAPDAETAAEALRRGMIGVQLSIEGAFPFEPSKDNRASLSRYLADPKNGLRDDFPHPTGAELNEPQGLLLYAKRLGVQSLSLNHLASSCFSGSDLWPNSHRGGGITPEGRQLVRDAASVGIMLDLAHASQAAQLDAVDMVDRGEYSLPLTVSHALVEPPGQKANWRATAPQVLDAVRRTGGIVGVMAARAYLPHGGSSDPEEIIKDVADQVDIIRARTGIDHIGLGLDADGFVGLPYKTSAEVAAALKKELQRRGYSEDDLLKMYGGNYLHVLQRRDQLMGISSEAASAKIAACEFRPTESL